MKITWLEFQLGLAIIAPDCRLQDLATAPVVHVYDEAWLRDEFWPYWGDVKRTLNTLPEQPLTNNSLRRNCEEINKRFVAELILSTRRLYGDEDVGAAALESSVLIPNGVSLCGVRDGAHRNAILAVTKNGQPHRYVFVESQLNYSNYETCNVADALARGVSLRECWL